VAATLTQAGKKRGRYEVKGQDEAKYAIVTALESGSLRSYAPGVSRVARSTFYKWLATDQNFAQHVEFAEARRTKRFLEQLEKECFAPYKTRGDTKSLFRLLQASAPEYRTSSSSRTNIGQAGETNIIISEERMEKIRQLKQAALAGMTTGLEAPIGRVKLP
jgi:hypothetical protein